MARPQYQLDLRQWVILGSGLDASKVRWSNPRKGDVGVLVARPKVEDWPYITIRTTGEETTGTGIRRLTDTPLGSGYKMKSSHEVEGFLLVNVYGYNADEIMTALVSSLGDPGVEEFFDGATVRVTQSGGSSASFDVDLLDTVLEDRAVRSFLYRRDAYRELEVDAIETVITTQN